METQEIRPRLPQYKWAVKYKNDTTDFALFVGYMDAETFLAALEAGSEAGLHEIVPIETITEES